MIQLLTKIPRHCYVACSGGVDSMAALDFLSRNHKVTAVFLHHGTEDSDRAHFFVRSYCKEKDYGFLFGSINKQKPAKESWEEFWRIERYKFFESLKQPVVTAHHLDDAVETWVWSSTHGTPKLPAIHRGNILRPFLTTPKNELISWCQRKNVRWIEDLSNNDIRFTRNLVRKEVMPMILKINPGIHKVIKKRLLDQAKDVKLVVNNGLVA